MGRISLRIPDLLEQDVRETVKTSEYSNISELIRDLLRDWVAHRHMDTKAKQK